jgi:hypothetical protein
MDDPCPLADRLGSGELRYDGRDRVVRNGDEHELAGASRVGSFDERDSREIPGHALA